MGTTLSDYTCKLPNKSTLNLNSDPAEPDYTCLCKQCRSKSFAVFKPGISVLGPNGPYPPKSWGHKKKSGDNTINDQNFIENVPVGVRCEYFAPCNLFL